MAAFQQQQEDLEIYVLDDGDIIEVTPVHRVIPVIDLTSDDEDISEVVAAPVAAPAVPQSQECVVCQDAVANTVTYPCNHQVTCDRCFRHIWYNNLHGDKCVICRQEIDEYVHNL